MSKKNFRYQPFVAVSGNVGGKVPIVDDVLSSHEQEFYPNTSLDENCMALKVKFVKGRAYDTYESKEKKRSTKMSLLFLLKQAMTTAKKRK